MAKSSEPSKTLRIIPLRKMHIIWLFCKAGVGLKMLTREIPGIPMVEVRRRVLNSKSWGRADTIPEQRAYERRAWVALEGMRDGRECHDMPDYEIACVGSIPTLEMEKPKDVLTPSGQRVLVESILGADLPDPQATIEAAEEKGAGPSKIIAEIQRLLNSKALAIVTKTGLAEVPIPTDVRYAKDGEVENVEAGSIFLLGQWWDKSCIVEDRKGVELGLKMSKEILNISDKDQLNMRIARSKAIGEEVDREFKEAERLRKIHEESKIALQEGKEVGTGLVMVRPKMLSLEEQFARQSNVKRIDVEEEVS
jgi:hypothetical protein